VGVLAKEEGPNNRGGIRYGGVTLERNGRASIRTEYEEGEFVSAYQVMRILGLASLVIELTGSRSRIVHRPRPQDDPRQRRPDISKANDLLGWAPKTQLSEGLNETIEYFESLLSDNTLRASIADQSTGGLALGEGG
jgi:hypothetical protein